MHDDQLDIDDDVVRRLIADQFPAWSAEPLVRVPGSYETPLAAQVLLERSDVDALVVLGYIERGETLHGEVMGHVVHRALLDASLRHRKPVGFGFIGPGALPRQAEKRKDEYARAAVRAAVQMLGVLGDLERAQDGLGAAAGAKPRRRARKSAAR